MTDAERLEAAGVMAGLGPWDCQAREWMGIHEETWCQCVGVPVFDHERYRYRIRPAPPAPLPCPCLCCGAPTLPAADPDWYHCVKCGCGWLASKLRRAACPKCAGNAKTTAEADAFCRDRDAWKESYYEAYRASKGWEEEAFESSARAEAAEKRCAEVERKVRHWAHNIPPGIAGDLLTTLEGRDHAN